MKMELISERFLSRIWVEGGIHQIDGWCNSHPTEQHKHNFSLNWIECLAVTDGPGDFSSSSFPPLESGQSQILPLIVEAEMSANVPTRMRIVIIITLGRVIPPHNNSVTTRLRTLRASRTHLTSYLKWNKNEFLDESSHISPCKNSAWKSEEVWEYFLLDIILFV